MTFPRLQRRRERHVSDGPATPDICGGDGSISILSTGLAAGNTTPDPFAFASQNNVPVTSVRTASSADRGTYRADRGCVRRRAARQHLLRVRTGSIFQGGCTLDVDGIGTVDALTDGLILLRAMFGLRFSLLCHWTRLQLALVVGYCYNCWLRNPHPPISSTGLIYMPALRLRENEPFEAALRRFKRTIEKTGLLTELRAREFYEKPTAERKRKLAAAVKRHYKRLRSQTLPPKLY